MSSLKKIIAVIGATGGQGGSVINTLLSSPKTSSEWAIRGITRDASKESSKKLASRGVEVVTGDVNSKESMLAAFKGAYAVFAVTNYWETLDQNLEIQQGKNIADAALESGVQHFIWSSLRNVKQMTNGKLPNVHHFDSKAAVESYIRTSLPTLPTTYLLAGLYMSNIPGQWLRPSPQPPHNYTLSLPVPSSSPVPLFATLSDTGKLVKGILNHREETLGKRVLAATKYYTLDEMLEGARGYYEVDRETYLGWMTGAGLPEFAAVELYENMRLLAEGGYYGGEGLEWSHSLVDEPLTTWEEYIKSSEAFKDLK
ncbi:NmrA-like family protein [Cadophora sp. MPI-SDFR-AT-0126]|nr:NmrA-like family protein [Leotiomycetes sp. MPI-SDFR-AT-0126]